MNNTKAIAIYLPQFHPIPENDEWWGKGFTEWTNVTKARPLFKNHHQPHLPSESGFYDLRLDEVRLEQENTAKKYGIHGFCYYHYWFNGKRLLHEPIDRKLKNPKEDLPFMLFWANETWSRRWLGEEKEVLIKQTYSIDDDYAHAEWLCKYAFSDSRYIKINNRPVFVLYRPSDLPNIEKTISILKETAVKYGLPKPYLIGCNSHSIPSQLFDQVLNFEPQLGLLPDAFNDKLSLSKLIRNAKMGIFSAKLKVYDYSFVKKIMHDRLSRNKSIPCVFVGWDNTARRGKNGIIMINQNVHDFSESLHHAKKMVEDYPEQEKIVFINAWNEWAEGNHLEPDLKNGTKYLEIVNEVFNA